MSQSVFQGIVHVLILIHAHRGHRINTRLWASRAWTRRARCSTPWRNFRLVPSFSDDQRETNMCFSWAPMGFDKL